MSRTLLTMLLTVLAAAFAASAYCAGESGAKDAKVSVQKPALEPYMLEPWDFQDPAKFKSLLKEREDLQFKMFNLRTKLISEDAELQALHKKIMAMHKELAGLLDARKDMRKLTDKLKDLDAELDRLPRKDSAK